MSAWWKAMSASWKCSSTAGLWGRAAVSSMRAKAFSSRATSLRVARSAAMPGGLDLEDAAALEVLGEDLAPAPGLQRRGQHVGIEDVPVLGRVDGRALAVLDRDQAALLHGPDRLARHAAADVELLRQVDLARQHLPRRRGRRRRRPR